MIIDNQNIFFSDNLDLLIKAWPLLEFETR